MEQSREGLEVGLKSECWVKAPHMLDPSAGPERSQSVRVPKAIKLENCTYFFFLSGAGIQHGPGVLEPLLGG